MYKSALGHLPQRMESRQQTQCESGDRDLSHSEDEPGGVPDQGDRDDTGAGVQENLEIEHPPDPILPPELEMECAKARSVLNANIAACFVKLVSFLTRCDII